MDSNTTTLQELSPGGIWISERKLWFSGVYLRSRMTVIRLADGRLWVHSAGEPTPALCAELDRLGQVGWVIVPNKWHHMNAAAMKARYPDAQLIGPASAALKNKSVIFDLGNDDERLPSLVPELSPVVFRGVPFLDETLFFHTKTNTLIGADLMMCGCPADHWTWRWVSRVLGQYQRHKAPPDVRWNTRGGPEVHQSLDEISRLPVARILVAHSDPIEDRPLEQLKDAWRFVRR